MHNMLKVFHSSDTVDTVILAQPKPRNVAFKDNAKEHIENGEMDKLRVLLYDTFSNLNRLVDAFAEESPNDVRIVNLVIFYFTIGKLDRLVQIHDRCHQPVDIRKCHQNIA